MQSKSLVIVTLFVALASLGLSVSSIKSTKQVQVVDTLDKVQSTHKIEACTVIDPPGVIKDPKTGQFSGEHIDALNLIAKKINVTVNWTETTFGNAAADLQSHRCDVVATDIFANVPRAAVVAFTYPPLLYIGDSAVVKKDSPYAGISNIYDFDKPNITVAVATGDAGDIFVKENFTQAKIVRIDVESSDLTRFALEVSAGRADVAISDSNTIRLYAAQHPEVTDLFQNNPFSLNPVAWAVRQDDPRWLGFLQTSLQFLETQGIFSQLESKYGAHWLHQVQTYQSK